MKKNKIFLITLVLLSVLMAGQSVFAGKEAKSTDTMTAAEKEKHKQHMLDAVEKTLQELYAKHPDAQKAVESAAGYAVFTNTGYNLAIFVGGSGHGVAFKNSDQKPVYMAMKKAGTGPGLGYVNYRQVIIFPNETLYDEFTTVGMQGSASANFTLKTDTLNTDASDAISLVPGVSVYQITDDGIDVQANWGGMMYYKDSELN